MLFIINCSIVFDQFSNRLSLVTQADSYINLSNSGSRLLYYFVNNPRKTCLKETLLTCVWEDFGLNPSQNNLYITVSQLRKAFNLLGDYSDLIETIPKTGFRLNADIETKTIDSSAESLSSLASPLSTSDLPVQNEIKPRNIVFIFTSIFLIVISLVAVNFYNKTKIHYLPSTDILILKEDNCHIYGDKHILKPADKNDILFVLKSRNVDCVNKTKNLYFERYLLPIPSETGLFLSVCTDARCNTLKHITESP
ncbi:hypothetical protein FKD80_23715 [Salmonella enterica]|nr:hypothetical protein [Salmonella enterica]